MRLTGIKAGDLVECDVRGQRFFARADGPGNGRLAVLPLDHRVTNRAVSAREVIGHYRKAKGSR